MLYLLSFVIPFLIGRTALGVVPTIQCTENERSIIFEEGIDDYLLDMRDVSAENTLIGGVIKRNDRQKYLMQMRIPKTKGEDANRFPSCLFGEARPLLFACSSVKIIEKVKVTNVLTGEITEVEAGSISLHTTVVKRDTLDFQGKVQTENLLRLHAVMDVTPPAKAPDAAPSLGAALSPAVPVRVIRAPGLPNPGFVPPAPAPPGPARADTEFRLISCKTGEQAESPAR